MSDSSQKLCSVLVCTYNRADLLRQTLESLCHQTLDNSLFEVIIVDDGSQDSTRETALSFESRLPMRYSYQRNAGLASARNHAIFLAKGDIVLLLDDDDIAAPSLLEEHLRTHQLHPDDNVGVLGYTTLAADIASDPVMHFVTEVGKFLFSYSDIECGQILDFSYFWGGRSSCKRRFLLEYGIFNSIFRFGCEDIELGYRLGKYGFRVVYNAHAITTTVRPITYDQFCERLIKQGRSNFFFSQLHSESEVRAWTEVDDLQKWPLLESVYETMRKSGRELDTIFRTKQKIGIETEEDRELLHEAYWTAFRASKIKGIADAAKPTKLLGSTLAGAAYQTALGEVELKSLIEFMRQEIADLRKVVESQQPTWMEKLQRDNYLANTAQTSQLLLKGHYQRLHREGMSMPSLADVEFRCNSQNGEDGIIHYVFSMIEYGPKKAVEICVGHGIECNAANLVINHGWDALLFDGDEDNISRAREFYRICQDTFSRQPALVHAWITKDNVDALIAEHGYVGEVGLLSIDIDGMDYWIWKAIQGISPRLVIVEFNPVWGPDMSVSVPYDANFKMDYSRTPFYCSASLTAYCKLAEEKGYRLIGVQRLGFNAFFLRKDLGQDVIPTVSPADCFRMSPALQEWTPNWIPSVEERPEFGKTMDV